MIVIDASALLEILIGSGVGKQLEAEVSDQALHAPHLIDVEVLNTIRRWEVRAEITPNEGAAYVAAFLALPIQRHEHTNLVSDIWAERHSLTAYDAAYLALARVLDAELITMDAGLRRRAKRRR